MKIQVKMIYTMAFNPDVVYKKVIKTGNGTMSWDMYSINDILRELKEEHCVDGSGFLDQ